MRVLHCCLACFYIDDFGYQENILPRMHKLQGHDVAIVASTETYVEGLKLGYTTARSYETADGIPITRLPYIGHLPRPIAAKLRIYKGVFEALHAFKPDVIFLHDCQFLSIRSVKRFAKANPAVRIYVDGHTDFGNSARGWISRRILHGIIYRYCAKLIDPFTTKFYGVLPARVDFFRQVYGIDPAKIDLLVLGADDSRAGMERRTQIRSEVRAKLGVAPSDLLIVTGGKIDRRKNIHALMQAVREIDQPHVKLVVFGAATDEMTREIAELAVHSSIRYAGWVSPDDVYGYLHAADFAVFPGTHSVLWEQAVGVGLPCLFRSWPGMRHVDVGGNCEFLERGSVDEIKSAILAIAGNRHRLAEMRSAALEHGVAQFSYSRIAARAIASD